MALSGVLFLVVFAYIPMFGLVIAFQNLDYQLDVMKGLFSSPLVGFSEFKEFLLDPNFISIMMNTIGLNLLQLCINFPAPIIFALIINEVMHPKFKSAIQTITYFPYFVSWVVFGGIILGIISPEGGVLNEALLKMGLIHKAIPFASQPQYFWTIIILTSLLKGLGWGSIIYIAAIAGIDQAQYEAATIDGAGRFQRMLYITLPGITGTIIIFLLLSISNLLSSGFDQIWVFQNPMNLARSEVIDTYVYKIGVTQFRYSYTTAVGLFKSVVALILLTSGHLVSKKVVGRGLF